ncbi:right-handed parallel beta-helix repeat-containing protein [Herbiconiux sp. CPCC 205716]|uniref:Right-handed parallel beta-helix repeat-containing protein n=1 Tax=Herbiconiux gentiana TaxID=2970912 RepID=A0ABT2GEX3_9MICO|nr:right-handed parallel beta-helix repeat-containing protein [Herbiconiux gentiana]MCS5714666.1 right-handed parallel beta-helix repeat-containing protein [Herbiconiux gentiana]
MSGGPDEGKAGLLSAAERGQTMSAGARWAVRALVVAVIVVGLGATVAVANGVPPRVSAFVQGVLGGAAGAATAGPSAGAAASATTDATTDSTTPPGEALTNATNPAGDATAPAGDATTDATTAADTSTGLIDPRTDPDAYKAALQQARDAADPAAVTPDAAELAAYERALEVTRGTSTTPEEHGESPGDVAQSRLVRLQDARWSLIARTGAPATRADTVDVVPAGTRVSLDQLVARGSATRVDDTTVLVTRSVFVARGAVLDLTAPGQSIRLLSGAHGAVSIVAWGGTVTLAGTTDSPVALTSWDEDAGASDLDVSDGRSYLRVHEGTLSIDHANVADLGYWSGRTGGIAVTGTLAAASTATVTHSVITGQHIGLYLAFSAAPTIDDTLVRASSAQAVVLANGTSSPVISASTLTGSGGDGLVVRPGVDDVTLTGSTVTRNGAYGIRADGRPQADAANSSGFSVEGSWGLAIDGSTIGDNRAGGLWVRGTGGVDLEGNTVDQRTVGLRLTDAQGTVAQNTVHVEPGDGIVLEGASTAVTARANLVTGEGPSAIRLPEDGTGTVAESGNDTTGWTGRWEALLWVEAHPLALLWGLLLVIPIVGIGFVFYRMRRQRAIRELVEASTIAIAAAEKTRYERDRAGGEAEPPLGSAADAGAPSASAAAPSGSAAAPSAQRTVPRAGGTAYRPGRETVAPESRYTHRPAATAGAAAAARSAAPQHPAAPPHRAAPPNQHAPAAPRPAPARAATKTLTPPPSIAGSDFGQFSSVEELAVAAVLDAGKPIDSVAHALRVPIGSVAGWVAKARRARGEL